MFQRDYLFLTVKMRLKVFQYKIRSHKIKFITHYYTLLLIKNIIV